MYLYVSLSLSAHIHISNMCIFMHSNFIIDAKFTKIYLQITDICFYLILFYTYLSKPLHNHLSQYIKYNVKILLLNTLCAHTPFIKKKRKAKDTSHKDKTKPLLNKSIYQKKNCVNQKYRKQ